MAQLHNALNLAQRGRWAPALKGGRHRSRRGPGPVRLWRRRRIVRGEQLGTGHHRHLAAPHRRLLPAGGRGAQATRSGGVHQRQRRAAGPQGGAQDRRRREQRGQGRHRLQAADQPGQGGPRRRHVLPAGELPAPRSPRSTACSTSSRPAPPKMFTHGFKRLFFAQQATADNHPDVFVDYIKSLPADQRPKTAAYPTQDDPFTAPVIESMQKELEALGVKTVTRRPTRPTRPTSRHRQRDRGGQAGPGRPGRGVRGRRGAHPLAAAAQLLAEVPVPDVGARRRATSSATASARRTPRASSTRSAGTRTAKTPTTTSSSPTTRSATTATSRPRTPPTPTPRPRSCRPRPRPWGSTTRQDGAVAARAHRRDHPRPAELGRDRRPESEFLLGQWQHGTVEIVAPKDAATSTPPSPRRPGSDSPPGGP